MQDKKKIDQAEQECVMTPQPHLPVPAIIYQLVETFEHNNDALK
jgi:hypothetical protein